ncbi:MAG: hypothetical protein LBR29_04545 [Methylobacteriaceae bacterium]|jgi:hypothetical protein|nr:hypothetical protein [Methylobacteriaceae bacterium]
MKLKSGLMGLLCLVLCGCNYSVATKAVPITLSEYRISVTEPLGNAGDYLLLKAAETTLAAGKTHFEIISDQDVGTRSSTSTHGGFSSTYTSTARDMIIRVGDTGINARQVVQNLRPRVKRDLVLWR